MRITKIGIPPGGDTDQILIKTSDSDYDVEWADNSSTGGSPGGANTQVQFNDGGNFGGDAGLTYDKTTDRLTAGSLSLNTITNATTDTDKFLVSDGGVLKYRIGTEILSDIGGVSTSRTITINGTSFDLSANRTYSVGTVTSVGGTGTVNGITLTGSITSSGNLTLGGTLSGVSLTTQVSGTLPIANGGTGLTTLGTAGQLLKVNSGVTALEYFTPTYISGNQTITLSGHVTGSGATAITTTIANGVVTNAMLVNSSITIQGTSTALGGSVNVINGTGFVKATGTTISYDNSTYYLASNPNGYTTNTGTVTSIATSSPITGGTITTSGTIGITQSSGSADGYLSSTDWTTFNNKFTLPSLTSGSVLFSNGTTIAQDNANFFWDDANNRLGIGTASPASILEIKSADPNFTINQTTNNNNSGVRFQTNGTQIGYITAQGSNGNMDINMGVTSGWGGYITFKTDTSERMRLTSAGRLLLGTATESTYLLDVNGTGRFSNTLEVTVNAGTSAYSLAGFPFLRWSAGDILDFGGFGATWTSLRFYANNAESFRITSTGNLEMRSANEILLYNSVNDNAATLKVWEDITSGGGFKLDVGSGNALSITNAGAATFSSSVTVNGSAYFGTFNSSNKYYFEPFSNLAGGANNAYLTSGKTDNNERSGFVFQGRNSNGEEYNAFILEGYSSTSTTPALTINGSGQFKFGNYTSSSSFTGTAQGYLAFTSTGEVITTGNPASGGVTGSGTTNYVTKFTSSSAVGDSSITDNGTTVELLQGQLKFPATQNASTDVNTLDDYEEGTWTPYYKMSGTNFSSITYDVLRAGRYQKIGRWVYLNGYIRTDAITKGSASGSVLVGGLPFTISETPVGNFTITYAEAFLSEYPRAGSTNAGLGDAATEFVLYRTRPSQTDADVALGIEDLNTGADDNYIVFYGFYRALN